MPLSMLRYLIFWKLLIVVWMPLLPLTLRSKRASTRMPVNLCISRCWLREVTMDWNSIYQSRITTPQEAVRAIKSRDRIFLTGNVSVPQKVLAALVEYAPNLENVEICQALTIGPADYVNPDMEGHLRVNTLFISHNVRKAVQELSLIHIS